MAEYRKWSKIKDPIFRIIAYYKESQELDKKLEYVDVLKDLSDQEYHEIEQGLLIQGYIIKRDYYEFGKKKIQIGRSGYSYFTLEETKLRREFEETKEYLSQVRKELHQIQEVKESLEKENAVLKEQKSICTVSLGQKPLGDEVSIKEIFELYLEGKSLQEIADLFNTRGIATKRGGRWYKSTVKYILENKKYVEMNYISQGDYLKVQELLKEKRKFNNLV